MVITRLNKEEVQLKLILQTNISVFSILEAAVFMLQSEECDHMHVPSKCKKSESFQKSFTLNRV